MAPCRVMAPIGTGCQHLQKPARSNHSVCEAVVTTPGSSENAMNTFRAGAKPCPCKMP